MSLHLVPGAPLVVGIPVAVGRVVAQGVAIVEGVVVQAVNEVTDAVELVLGNVQSLLDLMGPAGYVPGVPRALPGRLLQGISSYGARLNAENARNEALGFPLPERFELPDLRRGERFEIPPAYRTEANFPNLPRSFFRGPYQGG